MNNEVEFALLLKSHGPEKAKQLLSERYSMYGDQKPLIILNNPKPVVPEPVKKARNRKSKVNKFLEEFISSGTKSYDRYIPLNTLWNGYISTITENKSDFANKILTADWHGAEISVSASKSTGFVGKRGILLWEARTMFVIVSRDNKIYRIPKKGSVFEMHGLDRSIKLVGDRLLCRSAERTTKKFKPRDVKDIQGLFPVD